uniref:hypothetical protein n=1 Tax=Carnobacterium sp. TaxID=48221 RepID=UPI00344C423F
MELVLLLEVKDDNKIIVYNPNNKKEYTINAGTEEAGYYKEMLEESEHDVMVIFDTETEQLSSITNEQELR